MVVVAVEVKQKKKKKGRRESEKFFVVERAINAQFAWQEAVNRNWNNLLGNESGGKQNLHYLIC